MTDGESQPVCPCVHCGGLPDTKSPDWDLLLGKRHLPSASVLLTPGNPSLEGVSFLVEELVSCAPHSLKILQDSGAELPLKMSVPLSHRNLQNLKASSGSVLECVGANTEVGVAVPQRKPRASKWHRQQGLAHCCRKWCCWQNFCMHRQPRRTHGALLPTLPGALRTPSALQWPEVLGSVLGALMDREFHLRTGDSSVLQRLTANTVDVPQALVAYCHCGE